MDARTVVSTRLQVLRTPLLLPTVTVALSGRMMLPANCGIVDQVLESFGLPVYNWFSEIRASFGVLVLILSSFYIKKAIK